LCCIFDILYIVRVGLCLSLRRLYCSILFPYTTLFRSGMKESKFKDIVVASEVLQDGIFDLIDAGVVKFAAGTAFSLSDKRVKSLAEDLTKYQDRIVFRPQEISNNPEVIRRLGII